MGNFLERLERMTPERRSYALSMLVQHMYETRKWPQLFNCLDNVEYGQAKLRYDPSTHALAQDFDLGRRAAAQETCTLEEGIARLPHLWKYTWSRYTLAKQAGSYPLAAYKALLCLRGEQEVLNLIEVVNDPVRKMEVLHMVAQWLGEQTGREQERTQILLRVDEVANTIVASAIKGEVKDWREFDDWYEIQPERASSMKEQALYELVLVLALARQWEGAERVIGVMKDFNWRQKALGELGQALAQAGQWERAERILDSVLIPMWRTNGLSDLGLALTQAGQAERAESLWTKAIADIDDMANLNWEDKAWSHLRPKLAQAKQYEPAYGIDYLELQLISINEKIYLGLTLALAGKRDRAEAVWTKAARLICDMADRGYKSDNVLHSLGLALIQARERDYAEYVIGNIEDSLLKAHGLSYLGWSLAQAQERDRAEAAWTEAERLIGYEEDSVKRDKAWHDLGVVLAQAGQAERTERVISNIGDNSQRVEVLSTLVQTLVKAGQAERAEVVWAEAKRIIGYKEEHFLKENALRQLGLTLMQEKQEDHAKVAWTEAKQIIYGMEDYTKREKERGLFSLGLTLTQAGQWNDAESLLSNLENAHWRDFKRRLQRLYDLVQDLIQGKKWENAEHVILLMKDTFNSNKSLCKLGIALAQEKQWEHAERVIHTIKDPLWRAYALSELGLILAQAQQEERAETVWTEAEHIVDTSKENSCRNLKLSLAQPEYWDQEEYWIGIEEDAYNIDKKWDPQQVNIKDEDQEDFFDSIWRTDERIIVRRKGLLQGKAWSSLWHNLTKVEQWERAERVITATENLLWRVYGLSTLGSALAQAGFWKRAEAVWTEAAPIIENFMDSSKRDEALSALGLALAQARQWKAAKQVISIIADASKRDQTLSAFGLALAQAGLWQESGQVVLHSITGSNWKNTTLYKIVQFLCQSKDWKNAENIISIIEDSHYKTLALSSYGIALAQAGQWKDAERIINTLADSSKKDEALSSLGLALAQAGQWKDAERIINTLTDSSTRDKGWRDIGLALVQAEQEKEAERIINTHLTDIISREKALHDIAEALTRKRQWEDDERIITSIRNNDTRIKALQALSVALNAAKEHKRLLCLVQREWLHVDTREWALELLPLANELIPLKPEIGPAFLKAFVWADTFLK